MGEEATNIEKLPSIVTMVLPANIMSVWSDVAPLLRPAVDRAGTHTIEDIRRILLASQAALWVQWENGRYVAAMVTEFKNYPRGLWLNIWLAGAPKGEHLQDGLWEPHLVRFAEVNGCIGITWAGRKGWKERNKHLKIHHEDVVYTVMLRDIARQSGEVAA